MTMEMIRTPGGQMPAYVAVPTAAGPWPEWWSFTISAG